MKYSRLLIPLLASGLALAGGQKARDLYYIEDVPSQPLGLKFEIHKRGADGLAVGVEPSHQFLSGDRFRLLFESNQAGFLYLIHQGTSGNWKVLFPSRISPDNRVDEGTTVQVPPRTWYHFDETRGEEKLTILLTAEPLEDPAAQIIGYRTRDLVFEEDRSISEQYAVSPTREKIRIDLALTHR